MTEWNTVEIPRGTFLSFAKKGQVFTVKVVSFDPAGGRDFNDGICPQLVGTLTEDADNYRDKGTTHEALKAGTLVTINAGLYDVRKGLLIADPKPGDLVRMTYEADEKVDKGTVKRIKVEHARAGAIDEPDDL